MFQPLAPPDVICIPTVVRKPQKTDPASPSWGPHALAPRPLFPSSNFGSFRPLSTKTHSFFHDGSSAEGRGKESSAGAQSAPPHSKAKRKARLWDWNKKQRKKALKLARGLRLSWASLSPKKVLVFKKVQVMRAGEKRFVQVSKCLEKVDIHKAHKRSAN